MIVLDGELHIILKPRKLKNLRAFDFCQLLTKNMFNWLNWLNNAENLVIFKFRKYKFDLKGNLVNN